MKSFLTLAAILFALCALGQEPKQNSISSDCVYAMKGQLTFPGGNSALFSYLKKNIVYPDSAKIKGIQGDVYVSFTVDSAGRISGAKILRGVSPDINKEAVRVISQMPPWQWDKTIKPTDRKCTLVLPIRFTLAGPEKNQTNPKKK